MSAKTRRDGMPQAGTSCTYKGIASCRQGVKWQGAWLELGASIIGFVPGGDIAKGIAKGVTKGATKGATKIAAEPVQEVANLAKASTAKVADVLPNGQRGAIKARQATPRGPPKANPAAETGSYTNTHVSGKVYVGKGPRTRSQESGRRIGQNDAHVATDWTPAKNEREAFKDEARRLNAHDGPHAPGNYNKIESPGKRYLEQEEK